MERATHDPQRDPRPRNPQQRRATHDPQRDPRPRNPQQRRGALVATLLVLLLAWTTALAAVVVGVATGGGWETALRMIVTALVYAPAAGVVFSIRQFTIGSILAGLAVTSGIASLLLVLAPITAAAVPAQLLAGSAMHLAELAALGVLIWLLAEHRWRRVGLALGLAALLIDLVAVGLGLGGVAVPTPVQLTPLLLALMSFLLGAGCTAARWARGRGIERLMLIWFGLGAALLVLSYLHAVPDDETILDELSLAAFILAQSLLPTAILAAVFGGSGATIDRRLVTGIVWAQSLASAVGFYVLVDAVAVRLGADATVSGALAAALLALTFSVMLGVFRSLTGLVFFGPGISVRSVLTGIADTVARSDEHGGLAGLSSALRDAWHLRSVSVHSGGDAPEAGGGPAPQTGAELKEMQTQQDGDEGSAVLVHALVSGQNRIGTVVCTSDDSALLANVVGPMLEEIGGLVGVAVQLAAANQDLATLRDRTRGVSREERRMLHRELHDELAPALAGLGFALAGADRQVAAGSHGALDALHGLRAELAATTERVRRLARALLPAALDAGDLDAALRELARRFSGGGCAVSARAPGTDGLDGESQVTLYLVLADTVELLTREHWVTRIHLEVSLEGHSAVTRLRTDPAPESALPADALQRAIADRCAEAGGSLAADFAAGRCEAVIPV